MDKYVFSCLTFLFSATFLSSCETAKNKPVQITFSPDSTSIVFSNINPAGFWVAKDQLKTPQAAQQMIALVDITYEDHEGWKESLMPGKITSTATNLIFTPNQPLLKGHQYLITSYLNVHSATPGSLLRGNLTTNIKPTQTRLQR